MPCIQNLLNTLNALSNTHACSGAHLQKCVYQYIDVNSNFDTVKCAMYAAHFYNSTLYIKWKCQIKLHVKHNLTLMHTTL